MGQEAVSGDRVRAKASVSPSINHSLTIFDAPGDPMSQVVKVVLQGEVQKDYYERMWDIQRKLK